MAHIKPSATSTELAVVGAELSRPAAAYQLLRRSIDEIVVLRIFERPGKGVRNMSMAGIPINLGVRARTAPGSAGIAATGLIVLENPADWRGPMLRSLPAEQNRRGEGGFE
ncbi:hypothetical protein [Nocardia xishanensis]